MWIYSRRRNEQDHRFLMNLDLCSRINLTQLGEKWFIEVMLGADAHPVATLNSQEEADALLKQIFENLQAGAAALDLEALPEAEAPQKEQPPAPLAAAR